VDCRSHICRVEIPDHGSEELHKGMPVLPLEVARALPNVIADRLEGPNGATVVLYLRR
jgi:hypothetical protein